VKTGGFAFPQTRRLRVQLRRAWSGTRKRTTFARSSASVICSRSRLRVTPTLVFSSLASCKNTNDGRPLIQRAFIFRSLLWLFGGDFLEVSNMSEKLISRRGAFSLLGLAAALALPTTVLMTSDAEAQAQPSPAAPAPAAPAPTAAAPTAPATYGMNRRQARRAGRHERREARRNARHERREARRNAREMRREARHGNNLYMKSNTTKQK
jgi:hypothetical protein